MVQIWVTVALAADLALSWQPTDVQFGRGISGQNVTVLIDGRFMETTFAGKLAFRDRNRAWTSVCADVRAPITNGQAYTVLPIRSSRAGGHVALAGNIVAKYFNSARTADQCAGLQLAVWEAIEDGGRHADFGSGRFQARASRGALAYAAKYYEAVAEDGEAVFMQAGSAAGGGAGGGGQSQISTIT